MDKNKSTILVISYDNSKVKSINVHSHYIKYYKRYLKGFFLLCSFALVGILLLFYYIHSLNSEKNGLSDRLVKITNEVELIDSLKLKQKIDNINNNLLQINNYLQTRGIGSENEGGEMVNKEVTNPPWRTGISWESIPAGKIAYFEEKSNLFLNQISNVPLGIPLIGSLRRISSGYGYRFNPFGGYSGEFHPGIDIKGQVGDSVFATADGIVQRCDWYGGYGNAVVIDHGYGLTTLFGHLSRVNVEQGQTVKAGELIGFLGSTGRSTGPHVHYEIRRNGTPIDVTAFLRGAIFF